MEIVIATVIEITIRNEFFLLDIMISIVGYNEEVVDAFIDALSDEYARHVIKRGVYIPYMSLVIIESMSIQSIEFVHSICGKKIVLENIEHGTEDYIIREVICIYSPLYHDLRIIAQYGFLREMMEKDEYVSLFLNPLGLEICRNICEIYNVPTDHEVFARYEKHIEDSRGWLESNNI